ncbi:hypothetical protein N3K66_002791 [Trichothecium roseum]|uniref:Uncharacterized protein n=1 Tax=Trichothecium roseum TaxID=47278 RepID=A0ACC0VAV1_9HYPO|nr:hypothetical protein N3K66_002791 [Trichothecium roseum]
MVRLVASAAAAAALISTASGNPVAREATAKQLLGFDESAVRILKTNDIVPEITVLDNLGQDLNTTSVSALVLDDAEIAKRFINGADDRYQYTDDNYPFRAVGKLYWSNGVFCSGALVGPRHVLTAKHCLVDGQTGKFAPGFDNGPRFGEATVTNILTSGYEWGNPCGWKGDWAVMVLDQRLGDNLGYMGVKLPDAGLQDRPIFDHVGYPGDRDNGNRPYRTNGNPIQSFRPWDCDATGPFYSDTDCMGGQSGGPHWENTGDGPMVWGTLSVTFDGGNGVAWSGWGSGNEMLDAVIRMRNDYP